MTRTLAVTLALLLFGASASAQTTPIARLDCAPGTYPSCGGWTAIAENAYHTRRLVAGAGPEGQDVVQFDMLPGSAHAQYYLGWQRTIPVAPQGATRYIRMKLRVVGPLRLSTHAPEGGWASKFVILGDGGNSGNRVIVELKPTSVSQLSSRIQRNIDGDPNRTAQLALQTDGWHSLQWEVRSSSTAGAADAQLAMWQDSATYTSPTSRSGLFTLGTSTWSNLNIGYYASGVLVPDGRVSFQIAAVEYDDEFDPNWRVGSAPTPVDCTGTWGAWTRIAGSETACVAGSRTFREQALFTVTTPPANGGAACPASPESRTSTEPCAMPPVDTCIAAPLVVTSIAWPGSAEGARSGRFTWSVAGLVVTLQSVEFMWEPQRLRIADARGCSVTVTR